MKRATLITILFATVAVYGCSSGDGDGAAGSGGSGTAGTGGSGTAGTGGSGTAGTGGSGTAGTGGSGTAGTGGSGTAGTGGSGTAGTGGSGTAGTGGSGTAGTGGSGTAGTGGSGTAGTGGSGTAGTGGSGTAGTGGSGTAGTGGSAGAGGSAVCEYTQDFESLTPGDPPQVQPTSLANDGWLVGGNEFESDGTTPVGSYFAFPAPNGGPAFSAVAVGEGGAAQGAQQMSIYNDYNNPNHGDGPPDLNRIIEAVVFQERDLVAADVGNTISFTFDAKAGNIEGASTAEAFIQVLDKLGNSFAVLVDDVEVTTGFSTWQENTTLSVPIDASLVGQLLQFGGRSRASNFEGSGIFYDNMSVCSAPTP